MNRLLYIFLLLSTGFLLSAQGSKEQPLLSPADIADLSTWKLQLPVASESGTSVKEVYPEELKKGYQDEFFYLDPDSKAVVFRSPIKGFTTPNTTYTRCELRELIDGVHETTNWGFTGTHVMTVTESVEKLPTSGRIIVAQIHSIYPNGDNGPATIKVVYDGTTKEIETRVKVEASLSAGEKKFYFSNVELGQQFEVTLKIIDGVFYAYISSEGRTKAFSYDLLGTDPNWTTYLNYFKVGCYVQDDKEDYVGEEGIVKIYALTTFHSDKSEPIALKALKIEPEEVKVEAGSILQLSPVFIPIETTEKDVRFEIVKGRDVASVDRKGNVIYCVP